MRVSQVLFFFALGSALIWSALHIVYQRPILAGVLFPIGVLFVFLAGAFVFREIQGRRTRTQGSDADSEAQDRD